MTRLNNPLAWPLLGLLALMTLHGEAQAQRFVVSPDGTEVSDGLQGLVWRRCPEGRSLQAFRCTGGATLLLGHEAALLLAASQADATGLPWRLPTAKELAAVADLGTDRPAIDDAAFPDTPWVAFWSATPQVAHGGSSSALVVDFFQGYLTTRSRPSANALRLVRDAP